MKINEIRFEELTGDEGLSPCSGRSKLRFFDHDENGDSVLNGTIYMMADLIKELNNRESHHNDPRIVLIQEFLSEYPMDLPDLVPGTEYWPVTVLCRPKSSNLMIEYTDHAVTYAGEDGGYHIFRDQSKCWKLPANNTHEYNAEPSIFSTTLYLTDECGVFITYAVLKFGHWNFRLHLKETK